MFFLGLLTLLVLFYRSVYDLETEMLLLRLPRLRWSMGNSYPGHCMSRQCVFNLFWESDTPGQANNGSYWSHKKLWTEMQVLGRGRLVRDSGMQTSDEMLLGSGILWRRPILRQMLKLALGDRLRVADLLSRAMLAYYFSRYFKLLVTVGRGTIMQTCGVQHLPIFVNCLSFRSLHSVFVVPGYRYKTD